MKQIAVFCCTLQTSPRVRLFCWVRVKHEIHFYLNRISLGCLRAGGEISSLHETC